MQKRRLDLDIVRTWLCTAVMIGHVFGIVVPYYGRDYIGLSTTLAALSAVIRLNVPGFVFLAGYLALYRKKTFDARHFIRSRMRSTLPLYVLFTAIYAFLYLQPEGIQGFLEHLLQGTASYQLYFVPIVVQLYLLTPLLVYAVRRQPKITLPAAAVCSFGFSALCVIYPHPLLIGYFWCLPYLVYYVWGLAAGADSTEERLWGKRRGVWTTLIFLIVATTYGALAHRAGYGGFMLLPNPWYTFLLNLMDYTKNILGVLILRQIGHWAAQRLAPGSWGERLFTRASGYSYLVYLAHPILLEFLCRYIVRHPERLFLVFLPLMWFIVWLYDRAKQHFRAWREQRVKI